MAALEYRGICEGTVGLLVRQMESLGHDVAEMFAMSVVAT